MSVAVDLVKRSLGLIGAHSVVKPAVVELLNEGREVLNEMLAEWEEEKINMGTVTADDLTTDIAEPAGATHAIKYNLAVRMSEPARAPVSDKVQLEALESYERLKKRYKAKDEPNVPDATLSRHLPMGQGASRGALARTFFAGKPSTDEAPNT